MKTVTHVHTGLRERFLELNPLVPVRVVTVVPGVEYYGTVLTVGSDHVVLSTEFHTVTVALCHVVSAHREPFGLLDAGHRRFARATAPTLSTDAPVHQQRSSVNEDATVPTPRTPRAWRTWFPRRRATPSALPTSRAA